MLEKRAQNSQCISYKDLASELGITDAPVIATVTFTLEKLIDEDLIAGRPILSALVVQKGKKKLPRDGFFEKLNELNIINSDESDFNQKGWHVNELKKLKTYYKK